MTSTALLTVEAYGDSPAIADVEIVVPVYNEEADLEIAIRRLHGYLRDRMPVRCLVTIADNASRDQTWGIACRLAKQLDGVRAVHLDEKGRGRALRAAWSVSAARVVAYMDVDLSTDLDALLPLVAPLLSGHSDLAIGTRLAPGARVVRGPRREVISRGYNLILKATLRNGFSDAQCGFKAVRADVARALLPLVEDDGWFFDTELLVLAEHNGLRIHEVPVDWVDNADSRVQVASTAIGDLKGIWRMLRRFAAGGGALDAGAFAANGGALDVGAFAPIAVEPGLAGQVVRFAGVGAATTILFAAVFAFVADPLGPIAAEISAFAVCAPINLTANRRLTFGHRGHVGRRRHYGAGLVVAALPLGVGLGALLLARGSLAVDLGVVTVVNVVATVARFVVLREWVFR